MANTPITDVIMSAAEPLVRRARLMCEDGNFAKANDLVEQALNLIPEDPDAYVVALMAEKGCRLEEDLGRLRTGDLSQSGNYQKAVRFGDQGVRDRLAGYDAQSKADYEADERAKAEAAAERQRLEAEAAAKAKRLEAKLNGEAAAPRAKPRIRWRVLSVDEAASRALVITEDIIAQQPYHGPGGAITWSECSLRRWLNTEFWSSLPADLRSRVVEVTNQNNAGEATRDKVFLLDVAQAQSLFKGDPDRVASFEGTVGWWWLRSRGSHDSRAASVIDDGGVYFNGYFVDNSGGGVRPALFINL